MKKFLILLSFLIIGISYGQNSTVLEQKIVEYTKDAIASIEKVTISNINTLTEKVSYLAPNIQDNINILTSQIDDLTPDIKESVNSASSFISEAANDTKNVLIDGYNVAKPVVLEAIEVVMREIPILIKQFLWYKGIEAFIPILISILLLTYFRRKLIKWFSVSKLDAKASDKYLKDLHTSKQDALDYDLTEPFYSVKILNLHFNHIFSCIFFLIGNIIIFIISANLIFANLFNFIKIAFFSKLYLFELVLKHI